MKKLFKDRSEAGPKSPASRFSHPQDILRDPKLSPSQQLKLLEEWEQDVRLQLVASEESMTGPQPVELRDILKAKAELPVASETPPSTAKA